MEVSNQFIFINELPFANLTNYQIESLFQSTRHEIMTRLEESALLNYLKNKSSHNLNHSPNDIACNYYTEDEFNLRTKSIHGSLSIFHMNIRKLGKHRGALVAYLSCLNMKFDVIILTEVGKDSGCYIDNIFKNYKTVYDLPQINNYGGVAILVKNTLSPIERTDIKLDKSCDCTKCQIENTWMELKYQKKTVIIGGIYRHPGGNISHYNTTLEKTLPKIKKDDISIIGGDININLISKESKHDDYITTMNSHNYLPYITRPTRITSHSATLIDHLFMRVSSKDIEKTILSGNLFCDITDHLPNFLILPWGTVRKNIIERRKTRIYSEKNTLNFMNSIYDVDWNVELHKYDNANDMCSFLLSRLNKSYQESFPLVTVSRQREKDKPWITPSLRKAIQKKNRLYSKKIKHPTPENENKHREFKQSVTKMMNVAQSKYFQEIYDNKKTIHQSSLG